MSRCGFSQDTLIKAGYPILNEPITGCPIPIRNTDDKYELCGVNVYKSFSI